MRRLSPFVSLALVLMMAATSFGLAAVRADARPVGSIVICAGFGLQTILVDAEGNPTGTPQVCPDGLSAFTALIAALPVIPQVRRAAVAIAPRQADTIWNEAPGQSTLARGPPRRA